MKKLDIFGFDEALDMALSRTMSTLSTEVVMLDQVLGRVLAVDIECQKNLPSFDNSAMDGFAFKYSDVGTKLSIANTIFAGDSPEPMLGDKECYKIMTGAKVPSDADTIIPIEDCVEVSADFVTIAKDIKKGNALRVMGEEQRRGSVLIKSGEHLKFPHIAMLSAQGIVTVKVFRELSIAVLSTGDEIREPWQNASEDEIYNANAFGVTALLGQHGFSPNYIGSMADDLEKCKEQISRLKTYDVIITTGGISMGEADFLEEAFMANGLEKFFHGVNVKPGRPTMMGKIKHGSGSTTVMAMPGNPMTALLSIFLLSIPVLRKMQGEGNPKHTISKATISQSLRLKATRSNLVLGRLEQGVFHVIGDNKIGSGMLTPLMEANAVAIFVEGIAEVSEGSIVKVVIFF
ncbi:MAG: molybdopterin molybdotransferase MoeA [Sulfurovum sp.]|nr:molybdopterin molybdotransferase MoeA [Sulfurovum sp.]